jgi:transcriptional regulator with XRE-family HTH domain
MLTTCNEAMRFSETLRRLRDEAGLTQQQLADKAGLPVGSVRNHEQGQRLPSWRAVVRIARALGVPTDAFSKCDEVAGDEPAEEPAPRRRKRGKP